MRYKFCTKCGIKKRLSEFHKDKQKRGGSASRCRECRSNNPKLRAYTSKRYEAQLKCNYGITLDDYDKLCLDQNNVCAICEQPQLHQRLSVDHCHNTGKVRGLLCQSCNLTLGILEKLNFDTTKFQEYLGG